MVGRRRDPIEAAQLRCARRRRQAARYGWGTGAARGQLTDLYLLASYQAATSPDGDAAEDDAAEHQQLTDVLADRATAYAQLIDTARLTEQEIAP